MEGIQRVYDTGIGYAKSRYVPDTTVSAIWIMIYTFLVFWVTEFLFRSKAMRWLYIGSLAMIVSMIYAGSIRKEDVL